MGEVGVAGAIDILLVSVFLYAGLLWVQRTRSMGVLGGVAIFGGLYLVASFFGLALMATLLELLSAVLALALVVIFRDELRLLMERVARWRAWGPRSRNGSPREQYGEVEMLKRACGDLAGAQTGALILLPGSDAVDAHLVGGVELDGLASEELILSLFDPSSEGHDGALVLDHGRVVRFGCHLPLSTNQEELARKGTRHAAALGISERCDAMCIVVSEQRGSISVSHEGRLRTLDNVEELAALLHTFLGDVPQVKRAWTVAIRRHYGLKASAFGLSVLLWWVLVFGERPETRSFVVQVHSDPSSDQLVSVDPSTVSITLSGSRRNFYFLDSRTLRVNLPADSLRDGTSRVPITRSVVIAPPRLALKSVIPQQVQVTVRPARSSQTAR